MQRKLQAIYPEGSSKGRIAIITSQPTLIYEKRQSNVHGYKYFIVFVDDASRFNHQIPLKKKSDINRKFSELIENGSILI